MRYSFRAVWVGTVLLLWAGLAPGQTSSDASALRRQATQARAQAQDTRAQAQNWEQMAAKARAREASASGVMKETEAGLAANYEAQAANFKAQADALEQRARDLEAQADAAENSTKTAQSPQPEPSGGGASVAKAPESGATPNPTTVGSAVGCTGSPNSKPITLDDVVGVWRDADSGEEVEIRPAAHFAGRLPRGEGGKPIINMPLGEAPSTAQPVVLKGRHQWDGTFEAGKLKLHRLPDPNEMGTAPEWATKEVKGKVQWELELELACASDQPMLKGKWYPGSYKWTQEFEPSGEAKHSVSQIGRGTPIDIKYLPVPAHVYIYAKGVFQSYLVNKLYLDTPSFIGVAFEEPSKLSEYPISIQLNGVSLDLTAKPVDSNNKFFATDVFVVKGQ